MSEYRFAPFRVRILPTYQLLVEHGLATSEQLTNLPPTTEESILEHGIRFTVLRVGWQSSEGNLIYWDMFRSFSTEFELQIELSELAVPAAGVSRAIGLTSMAPGVYIDRGVGGLI